MKCLRATAGTIIRVEWNSIVTIESSRECATMTRSLYLEDVAPPGADASSFLVAHSTMKTAEPRGAHALPIEINRIEPQTYCEVKRARSAGAARGVQ